MERAPVAERTAEELNAAAALGSSPTATDLLVIGLLIGLILISVVGNCLVCVAIFTDRRLRKLGNAFIVSLAIADLFVSCLVMTFALCNDLMGHWIFGNWFCDVWISFDIMCCTASILNLCAISLDRFVHIKDCLLYNQWMTRRVAISAVIIIWFISGLVSFVPINLGWHKPNHFGTHSPLVVLNPLERPPMASSQAREHQHQRQQRHQTKLNYSTPNTHHMHGPVEDQSSLLSARNSAREPELRSANSGHKTDFVSFTNDTGNSSGWTRSESAQFNQVESNSQYGSQIGRDPLFLFSSPLGTPMPSNLDAQSQLPLCMLTLTPTYAIISSTISFYIPCIIMLGLYTKLFACARRHVRNIQAISKAPAPIAISLTVPISFEQNSGSQQTESPPIKTWLKFSSRKYLKNAQSHDKSRANERNGKPAIADYGRQNLSKQTSEKSLVDRMKPKQLQSTPEKPSSVDDGNENGTRSSTRPSLLSKENNKLAQRQWTTLDQIELVSSGLLDQMVRDKTSACGDKLISDSCSVLPEHESYRELNQLKRCPKEEEQYPFLAEETRDMTRKKLSGFDMSNQASSTGHIQPTAIAKTILAPNQQQQQQQSGQLATHKAAVTLGIIMGTFLFCWVPFFCLNIIKAFCVDCIPSSVFRAFTWLGYANSALNPIIYGIHNSEFRCAFNRIFFKHLNFKNSRYYLNRRFSYDPRQSNNRIRSRKSYSPTNSKLTHKSDTAA